MEINIKVNGEMVKEKEEEYIIIKMEKNTKVNGKIMHKMER